MSPKKKKKLATNSSQKAFLLLEDGTLFEGYGFGYRTTETGELVFHTGHTGYQEILSDPSYYRQLLCFTSAEVGNQGVHPDDLESERMWASGCIVRNYHDAPVHWRKKWSLDEYLKEQKRPGIFGVDTRRLVLKIREKGSLWAVISNEVRDPKKLKTYFSKASSMEGQALVTDVSTQASYPWMTGSVDLIRPSWKQARKSGRCVVFDFGVKRQILRYLIDAGFQEVLVVPATTKAEEVLALSPELVFLSNGPGDPAALPEVVNEVKKIIGKLPIFGICLGHQILGLALGAKTYKLKFGHHAANHPVRSDFFQRVEITSQNHGFAVKKDGTLNFNWTHTNLNDSSVEGFVDSKLKICAIQYHPEASPGPLDSIELFRAVYTQDIYKIRKAS